MELRDTVELMKSENEKDRLKAEYLQTKIRYDKLNKIVVKLEAGTCDFTPNCSVDLLKEQLEYMRMYLHMLEIRLEIEHIEL